MKWLDSVQEAAHRRYLNQELQKKVNRQPRNFKQVQTVGILVELVGEIEPLQGAVLGYARKLQSLQKDVHILGYSDQPKVPEGLSIEAFCRKDLSFALIPKHLAAKKFMETPFDVLIGVHFHACGVLEYIAAASPAHLRVGYFQETGGDCYDLMVKSPLHLPEAFLEKVHHYLNILNC